MKSYLSILICCLLTVLNVQAQSPRSSKDVLSIDNKGILHWKETGKEAAFFGVNYTVPFAYGYRSHLALGINPETAIDQDVYHLARLGINAFRVHVWDTEISDVKGNLLNNEHLRLFDYLVARLEARGIYILITPIAFWGNGYPEKNEATGSFSNVYGKEQSVVKEEAIVAQERYLSQFFKHINPYTKKTYGKDHFVVATEINNEPKHSGPKTLTTAYINRLKQAITHTGWTKPVFYNISESPLYADAVAASKADGFSFQWYPTGLVSGHEQKGNFLPNVDRYHLPFDTIPGFLHKPRIIYEFDAADILQSYMYPAMARSFRGAGFQWATQFAYDPLATAYGNTEYQTHYLNLAYTPSKAISLLIAGEVFRNTPLFKSYGSYPADTLFGNFRLSYAESLSEMNTRERFYYSNTTASPPQQADALKHIAGVGSSPVIRYDGNGAYFMDQLADGSWRLEVMPDVVRLSDPFATASADKEVNRMVWKANTMTVNLPGLKQDFYISGLNQGNTYHAKTANAAFTISPGTYLISKTLTAPAEQQTGAIGLREFVAPQAVTLQNPVQLFNPAAPSKDITFYLEEWSKNSYAFIPETAAQPAALELTHTAQPAQRDGGLEINIQELLRYQTNLSVYHYLVISAKANHELPLKISLISGSALSYGKTISLSTQPQEIRIPLSELQPVPLLLLPRPYPGFQPLYFQSAEKKQFQLAAMQKFQLSYQIPANTAEVITITGIRLEK